MAAWLQALVVLVGGGVVVSIVALARGWARELGADAERAESAQADLRVAREQGEIIAEQRTIEDAASRMDDGTF